MRGHGRFCVVLIENGKVLCTKANFTWFLSLFTDKNKIPLGILKFYCLLVLLSQKPKEWFAS